MISQKAKYAFRALLELAKAKTGDAVLISEIAERRNIPKKFLEQILLDLKHHGLVSSRRGKYGGYTLLKAPSDITFTQVMRIVDGPMAPLPCLSRTAYQRCDDCEDEASCETRRVFARAFAAGVAVLDRTTLADAMSDATPAKIHSRRPSAA
jgi:Rrf2 family protein